MVRINRQSPTRRRWNCCWDFFSMGRSFWVDDGGGLGRGGGMGNGDDGSSCGGWGGGSRAGADGAGAGAAEDARGTGADGADGAVDDDGGGAGCGTDVCCTGGTGVDDGSWGRAMAAGGSNSRFSRPFSESPPRLWSSRRLRRVPLTSRSIRAVAGWFLGFNLAAPASAATGSISGGIRRCSSTESALTSRQRGLEEDKARREIWGTAGARRGWRRRLPRGGG